MDLFCISDIVAKWDRRYLEDAHCFYQGTNLINNKIVLAQDAWLPRDSSFWHWITSNLLAECHENTPTHCEFLE